MQIAEKVFVVTGGASGLGQGTAAMLLEQGAKVVIADIQQSHEFAGFKEDQLRFVKCDVCSQEDAQQVIDAASSMGPLFGLINCAGVCPAQKTAGSKSAHDLDLFRKVIEVNLVGTFNMTRLAAQKMLENDPEPTGERGVIINTASVAAFEGQIGQAAYSASKAGVAGMTLPIARDLSSSGIRCVSIAPGIFGTPMIAQMPQDVQEALVANIPFPSRLGRPEDYAKMVQSIITNDMLNGCTIRLDGATRLQPR